MIRAITLRQADLHSPRSAEGVTPKPSIDGGLSSRFLRSHRTRQLWRRRANINGLSVMAWPGDERGQMIATAYAERDKMLF